MPARSLVLMFSGQGSQYYQMGRAFFDGNAKFRSELLRLDAVATRLVGRSMVDILYHDNRKKDEPFEAIQLTSAAIFMIEYALVRTLLDDGFKPNYLLAASLGVYAAAAAADVLDPADALECITRASTVYETRCPKGAMIAILGRPALHRELRALQDYSDVAAVNFDGHFVVSTLEKHVDQITSELDRNGVAFQKIPVSYPFHSRWMDGCADAAQAIFATLTYREPRIPIICCSQTTVVGPISSAAIWNAVRKPIEFQQSIAKLEMHGPCSYVDVGPAGTLATFLKYALPSTSASKAHPILSPFGVELKNYERLTSQRELFEHQPVNVS
jgi:bacillaene synthase trans-acting acyltransferase